MARTSKKAQLAKQVAKSTIYNTSIKTKSELRAESADAVALFLAKGGVIEQGRKPRARKEKPPAVLAAKVKYMKEFAGLKLKSKSYNPA